MRILLVLCALLAIAVTSLARPKDADNAHDKPTTALPLVTKNKNDVLNVTPAPVENSKEKLTNTPAVYVTTSVTTDKPKDNADKPADKPKDRTDKPADNPKDRPNSDTVPTKASNSVTTAVPTTKTTTVEPTTPTTPPPSPTVTTTTNIPTTTDSNPETTTALPPTTCPPLPGRHFDGLSFLGGIILTVCLIGVGVFLCKYCQKIQEDKYRTL